MLDWLPGANRVDLSANHGYGPFRQPFLGVVAHVNQGNTSDAFFAASTDVCPNFQVYADGSIHQYLPLNWQPWCQTAGNQQYAAIESAGYNTDPWTAPQVSSIAYILAAYRDNLGLSMQIADAPGQRGFGWHGMGGAAWGNHPGCPGEPRKAQRAQALTIAAGLSPSGGGTEIDVLDQNDIGMIYAAPITVPAQWSPSGQQTAGYVLSQILSLTTVLYNAQAGGLDYDKLAAAIVAKLPAVSGGITKQDVTDACEQALAGTPLIVSATIGAKTA